MVFSGTVGSGVTVAPLLAIVGPSSKAARARTFTHPLYLGRSYLSVSFSSYSNGFYSTTEGDPPQQPVSSDSPSL